MLLSILATFAQKRHAICVAPGFFFEISGLEAFHRQGDTTLGEGWTEILTALRSWKSNLGFPCSTFELGLSGCLGEGCSTFPGILGILRDL